MQNFNLLRGRRYDYRRGPFAEEISRTRVRVAIKADFGPERPVWIEAGLCQRDGKPALRDIVCRSYQPPLRTFNQPVDEPALASEVDNRKLTIGHTEECRVPAARKPRRSGWNRAALGLVVEAHFAADHGRIEREGRGAQTLDVADKLPHYLGAHGI